MKETRQVEKQFRVEMSNTTDGAYKAVVTSTYNVAGEAKEEVKEFMGASKGQVEKLVEAYKKE